MSVTAESAPRQAHYGRMMANALAVLIRRAGGSVTLTRSEFDSLTADKVAVQFDATTDTITFECVPVARGSEAVP